MKRKLISVLIIALIGSLLFALLTIGTIKNYFPIELNLLIASPVALATKVLGLDPNVYMNSEAFAIFVNSLFGAFLFILPALIWHFIMKGDNEK